MFWSKKSIVEEDRAVNLEPKLTVNDVLESGYSLREISNDNLVEIMENTGALTRIYNTLIHEYNRRISEGTQSSVFVNIKS